MSSMSEPSNPRTIEDEIRAAIAGSFLPERTAREDCPDWCTLDHRTDVDESAVLHLGDDHTDSTVRKLLDVHEGSTLDVRVARCDNNDEGTLGTPNLMVRCDLELATWEQAAELARTILDAFGYVADPNL